MLVHVHTLVHLTMHIHTHACTPPRNMQVKIRGRNNKKKENK